MRGFSFGWPLIILLWVFASSSSIARSMLYVEQRDDFVEGRGTKGDPFNGSSSGRLQKIVNEAPDGATLVFGKGVFPFGVDIKKSLTLVGKGKETIFQTDKVGRDAITFSGEKSTLFVKNLQMRYTGGWGDASDVTEGILVTSPAEGVVLDGVTFRDFYNCVYTVGPTRRLHVRNCVFLFSYGRAGVSNSAPFQHPAVAVLGSGSEETIVRDCYFDGLQDPTFEGVKGNPPKDQRTPMDGLYKTGGGNPKLTLIENNLVKNHGIEGILCERLDFTGDYTTRIRGNKTIGPTYKEHSFYGNYCPAIVVFNIQAAEVSDNLIKNSPMGIDVKFPGWAASNACSIRNNAVMNAVNGVRITHGGSETIITNNRIHCSSEPTKSVHSSDIEWCGLVGVAASGTPIVRSNAFRADEPAWDAKTTLLSRNKNLFHVSSTQGLQPNQGVLISRTTASLASFPVREIQGNTTTVEPGWANAQPKPSSGKLFYALKLGNFTQIGAVCSYGKTSRVVVEKNNIRWPLQDIATSNNGIIDSRSNQGKMLKR